ncbi:MAG: T9SS type A sorting domain-containing protein [Bacteroidota bacterium]|nr:T9SS type A sorting domain-containing protein [Bacteroidota bacterium]
MKRLFAYSFIIACFSTFSQRIQNVNVSLVNSQNQGANSQVLVRFTLSAGQPCPGYEILHCTDSLNYLQLYNYSGICGNTTADESFNFTHGSPGIEMVNYYKVSIPGFETSPAYRIYVGQQTPKPNILVFPNPVFDQEFIRLRFYNYVGTKVEGFIFSQFGKTVRPLLLDIKQDHGEVNINDLNDGLYIVWLTDGNWLFRSKFIVKRT